MESKTYIKRILDSTDEHKKEEVMELICELIEELDKDDYEEIERRLYEISEGKVLNEEIARKLIEKMKPYGKK